MTHHSKLVLELKMAMGKIHTDTNFVNPYTHAKIRICTYARNPQWVGNNTLPAIRGCIPTGTPAYPQALEIQAPKHILIACEY